jgi:holo-[acyl-carrier protein] synthase
VPHDRRPSAALRTDQVRDLVAVAADFSHLVPGVVGVGVDVVDLVEFEHNLRVGGSRWLRKLFTEAELATGQGRPERLGTRFAAKEAVVKALGTGFRAGVSARCVEIVSDPDGRPRVVLAGAAAVAALAREVGEVRVSMSREGGCAVAVALAVSSE